MSTITTIRYRSATNVNENDLSDEFGQRQRMYAVNSIVGGYSPVEAVHGDFAVHFAKLSEIGTNPALTPEGSDAPSSDSMGYADRILRDLFQIEFSPFRVMASAEGGVAICFVKGDKYSDIEILNNGEILGVTSNRKDRPLVWEIERNARGIARAIARIRKFFE